MFSHGFTFLSGEFASFMENLVKYKNIVELGKLGKNETFLFVAIGNKEYN